MVCIWVHQLQASFGVQCPKGWYPFHFRKSFNSSDSQVDLTSLLQRSVKTNPQTSRGDPIGPPGAASPSSPCSASVASPPARSRPRHHRHRRRRPQARPTLRPSTSSCAPGGTPMNVGWLLDCKNGWQSMEQNVSCYDVEHGIAGCKIWDGWKQYPGWKSMSTGTGHRLAARVFLQILCLSHLINLWALPLQCTC